MKTKMILFGSALFLISSLVNASLIHLEFSGIYGTDSALLGNLTFDSGTPPTTTSGTGFARYSIIDANVSMEGLTQSANLSNSSINIFNSNACMSVGDDYFQISLDLLGAPFIPFGLGNVAQLNIFWIDNDGKMFNDVSLPSGVPFLPQVDLVMGAFDTTPDFDLVYLSDVTLNQVTSVREPPYFGLVAYLIFLIYIVRSKKRSD